MREHSDSPQTPVPEAGLETTADLIARARAGDPAAQNLLVARFRPPLRRWAHARLPHFARDLMDTDDLVQNTLLRALERLRTFESRHRGSFLAYLVTIARNQILDEIRKVNRRPPREPLDECVQDRGISPLERAIGNQTLARIEAAMEKLPLEHQAAIIMRVEWGFSHSEIAEALDRPSPNASRLMVTRALLRLANEMKDAG